MRTALAAVAAALALPTTAHAGATLRAAFAARSYRPGDVALLRIVASPSADLVVQVFRAGGEARASLASAPVDRTVSGVAVTAPRRLHGPPAPWTLHLHVGNWPSGVYVARLIAPSGDRDYAPFVLRPSRLGAMTRVLVVEPTNTWEAYDFYAGDSWYENGGVHAIALGRPYIGDGLPPHFLDYDLGFLRWYARSARTADFVADDDLARFVDGAQLRRLYDLVVFPGHEEYVTGHVYDVVEQFRNRGGNLAFLSADNFFYAVRIDGETMLGRGVSADMTYYRHGHAQVFDAGVINFGASADWPVVSTLVDNLWRHLL